MAPGVITPSAMPSCRASPKCRFGSTVGYTWGFSSVPGIASMKGHESVVVSGLPWSFGPFSQTIPSPSPSRMHRYVGCDRLTGDR